ncbi:short-chain dehydrogenase reductase sdr [Moniliophthora roreri MCA 2997]|uniref:Short-chain dehydrogenase reductase sdr n=2 Tax=Moniliophthora roreri TaxID=221103 RepID=V2YRR0_MONRO|nr:short-chain dehydrogenase reductase sdr [Moniliophthora roreri MCA 2997]
MTSNPRTILVTGSNTGIGFELVRLLASKGHNVYLSSRNEEAGHNALKRLKDEYNLDVNYVQLDVTSEDSIAHAKAKIEAAEGKLDALVNNAAIAIIAGMPSNFDMKELTQTFDTNYLGVIRVTTAFIPLIRRAGNGVIVNVSSEVGSHTSQLQLPDLLPLSLAMYYGSKAALNSYTVALSRELKEEGIRVNSITPGLTETKLSGYARGRSATEGAEVILPWVLLSPGEDKTGLFYGHAVNGKVEEIPW